MTTGNSTQPIIGVLLVLSRPALGEFWTATSCRRFGWRLEGPILIRCSGRRDEAALESRAALGSRVHPEGSFLLVEVDGQLVAAAPLDVDAEPLRDPLRHTGNLRDLLEPQVDRGRLADPRAVASRTLADAV